MIVYLQHALKDGSAKNAIEGLENYDDGVACLKARYDRPWLIHRTHVQMIVDAPPLKERSWGSSTTTYSNTYVHWKRWDVTSAGRLLRRWSSWS